MPPLGALAYVLPSFNRTLASQCGKFRKYECLIYKHVQYIIREHKQTTHAYTHIYSNMSTYVNTVVYVYD